MATFQTYPPKAQVGGTLRHTVPLIKPAGPSRQTGWARSCDTECSVRLDFFLCHPFGSPQGKL